MFTVCMNMCMPTQDRRCVPGSTCWHPRRLHVIVPDILFHARQLLEMESSIFPDQHEHAMAGFYCWCDPDRGGDIHDSHRWGYSFPTLGALLHDTGFIQVERITSGKESEPWHLNVQAIKPGPSHPH